MRKKKIRFSKYQPHQGKKEKEKRIRQAKQEKEKNARDTTNTKV